jgi:hypothetical protein
MLARRTRGNTGRVADLTRLFVETVAGLVELRPFHFSRVFKQTTASPSCVGDPAQPARGRRRNLDALQGRQRRHAWYYRSLVTAFREHGDNALLDELDRVVTEIERVATAASFSPVVSLATNEPSHPGIG